MQSSDKNRRIVLNERPKGEPNDNTLRLEEASIPQPGDGEVLLRTVYLSLDPYMRGRMSAAKSYANPVEIGDTMVGGTVSRVVTSKNKRFNEGDWVLSQGGWQDYSITNGEGVINLGADTPNPSWALGILGMPGFTAWAGLEFIGEPKAGETVVVAAATGPVGATVGQIAKLKGCRVVGVAGGEEKCRYAIEELGFDACIDRREGDLKEALKEACPDGIDVYFENVGGAVFDAVLPLMNPHGRRPGPLSADPWHDPDAEAARSGLHHLRHFRPQVPRIPEGHAGLAEGREDQVSRGHGRRSGEGPAGALRHVEGRKLRQARRARRSRQLNELERRSSQQARGVLRQPFSNAHWRQSLHRGRLQRTGLAQAQACILFIV